MGRDIATLVVLFLLGGCLDAPRDTGEVAGPDAGSDSGSGSGSGSGAADDAAPGADGAPATLPCAEGSSAALAFPGHLTGPTGAVRHTQNGIALVINTGSQPLELAGLSLQFVRASDQRVVALGSVTVDEMVADPGEALGQLDGSVSASVSASVSEPWTNTVRPIVALTFDYDIDQETTVTIDLLASLDGMSAPFSIDLELEDVPYWVGRDADRVELSCSSD